MRWWRRTALAAWTFAACLGAQAHPDERAAAAALPQRVALLQRAQAELERGDAADALDDFERAAMMLHAADAELGLIRAAMQDGQYRRALAFCAHTAGEHTDDAEGGSLYAWLLRIGGQGDLAARVLANARASAPGDPVAEAVQAAFDTTPPMASGLLLEATHRMAPWPSGPLDGSRPPANARFVSNGVLIDDGAAAVVPSAGIPRRPNARLWVRNGLGQARSAQLDRVDDSLAAHGLVRLRLAAPLPVGSSRQAARAPFAGSPGFALQFGDTPAPAWPALAQGFLGTLVGATEVRRLGFVSAPGAAVLDAQGALVGITLPAADPAATWLPLVVAPRHPATSTPPPLPSHAGLTLPAPDEIYESGLWRALQVLVDP